MRRELADERAAFFGLVISIDAALAAIAAVEIRRGDVLAVDAFDIRRTPMARVVALASSCRKMSRRIEGVVAFNQEETPRLFAFRRNLVLAASAGTGKTHSLVGVLVHLVMGASELGGKGLRDAGQDLPRSRVFYGNCLSAAARPE